MIHNYLWTRHLSTVYLCVYQNVIELAKAAAAGFTASLFLRPRLASAKIERQNAKEYVFCLIAKIAHARSLIFKKTAHGGNILFRKNILLAELSSVILKLFWRKPIWNYKLNYIVAQYDYFYDCVHDKESILWIWICIFFERRVCAREEYATFFNQYVRPIVAASRRRFHPMSHLKAGTCVVIAKVRYGRWVTRHWNSIINLANHNVASSSAPGELSD